MNYLSLLPRLQAEAQRISRLIPDSTWFLFGSILFDPEKASDIDLLVVCHHQADGALMRRQLVQVCLDLPIHLTLLTVAEEREANFIHTEGCVPLQSLDGRTAKIGCERLQDSRLALE